MFCSVISHLPTEPGDIPEVKLHLYECHQIYLLFPKISLYAQTYIFLKYHHNIMVQHILNDTKMTGNCAMGIYYILEKDALVV